MTTQEKTKTAGNKLGLTEVQSFADLEREIDEDISQLMGRGNINTYSILDKLRESYGHIADFSFAQDSDLFWYVNSKVEKFISHASKQGIVAHGYSFLTLADAIAANALEIALDPGLDAGVRLAAGEKALTHAQSKIEFLMALEAAKRSASSLVVEENKPKELNSSDDDGINEGKTLAERVAVRAQRKKRREREAFEHQQERTQAKINHLENGRVN